MANGVRSLIDKSIAPAVLLLISCGMAIWLTPYLIKSAVFTLKIYDIPLTLPSSIVVFLALAAAGLVVMALTSADVVRVALSFVPIVGDTLEKAFTARLATRNASRPLALSQNLAVASFDELAQSCEYYVARAENWIPAHDADARMVQAIVECGVMNLLALARGVVDEFPPAGVIANAMTYDHSSQRLVLRGSTDYQSFDSVAAPWELKAAEIPDSDRHPGVCMRAFRGGKIVVVPDMTREELRHDEPICAMISIPLVSPPDAFDGALAVANINLFARGLVSDKLTDAQHARAARLQAIAATLNRIVSMSNDTKRVGAAKAGIALAANGSG